MGQGGMTTEDMDYEIMMEVRDIMRDLAHDPLLEPIKVTKSGLKRKGHGTRTVDELMKLKHIYEEVASGKPVDIKHLREEMEAVMEEIQRDIRCEKSEREIAAVKEDVEHKQDDISKLEGIEKALGETGSTTKAQDDMIKKEIAGIMRDLANDPLLDPPTITKRSLNAKGMNPRLIDEEMKLKKIYMEVAGGKQVDIKKLRAELEAVIAEIAADVAVEEEEAALLEDAEHKLKDVDMLEDFEKTLGTDGVTTAAQNKELMREITQIMRDLAKDPKLDPATVNKRSLRAKGLSPATIDEEMKLKHIYDEVASGKAVDVRHLRAELDDVMFEMEQDAIREREEAEFLKNTDEIFHEQHDVDELKGLEDGLDKDGMTTEDQDYEIMMAIRDIMRDLAKDPKLNPVAVTKKGLERKNFTPRLVDELLKLKKIYDEVASGKPVDIAHLRAEMDDVMEEMERDVRVKKSEREIMAVKEDVEHKQDEIGKLQDLEKALGETGNTTKAQDEIIKKQIALIMRDLADDPTLDPPTVTKRSLTAKGMNPRLIDEEIKLKKIYMEVADGKPVDIAQLRAELEAVMEELEEDVEVEKEKVELMQDAEVKHKDADMLKDFEKTLPKTGDTTLAQNEELKKEITQIMRDLAKDPTLLPSKVTKASLRAKGLSPTTIDEEMKLKHVYDEVCAGKPIDVTHLRSELDDVRFEIEQDAAREKAEIAFLKNTDEIAREKHDIDRLKKLEGALGGTGMTTEDQDYAIMCEIRDIMRDLAKDPKLNPVAVTKKGLERKKYTPRTVDELMKLKKIYNEVASGKPVDIAHLRAEMDDVMEELKGDIRIKKSEREIKKIEDDVAVKKDDIGAIKDLENALGDSGETTKAQDELIKRQIAMIMRDLANDPTLDPPTVTKRSLFVKGMNPRLIDEEMKLKKIYMEVAGGKPVDIANLRAELDAVMQELEEDVEIEEEEAELLEDAEHKLNDVDMLKNFEKTLGTDGVTTAE
jgi:predicted amino acid-binding ACT domain protein